VLSGGEIDQFMELGYVRVAETIPPDVARRCRDLANMEMGIPESAPWPGPVVRGLIEGEAFQDAANAPRLLTAVDQLLHGEAWQRRPNLGLLAVRFPSDEDPGDTGWHIDASFEGPATSSLTSWYVNYRSKGRGLLLLCLLSDVSVDDAPTRILEGSHLDLPGLLRPFGESGVINQDVPLTRDERAIALATGDAGDVFLCHPFLVHAATWPHRGTAPRYIAQPPISLDGPLRIDREENPSPVARTIQHALNS
jgi:Phytanoyl-CoA dioxygenase (PhyH)